MTTLAELRTAVGRDLRDPDLRTFLAATVDDLINAGIEEVSRVYPVEKVVSVTPVADTYEYDLSGESFINIFRVEHLRSDLFYSLVTPSDGDDQINGWEFFGGSLYFPRVSTANLVPATDEFRVWGYATRARLTDDAQVAELDETGEWAVRAYAKSSAFQLMHADRAIYKAWQAMSQNSDVSPNQLSQMVALYTSEWDRQRNHLRRLRRV
jgi:hypothetical protein